MLQARPAGPSPVGRPRWIAAIAIIGMAAGMIAPPAPAQSTGDAPAPAAAPSPSTSPTDNATVRDFLAHFAGTRNTQDKVPEKVVADVLWLTRVVGVAARHYKQQLDDAAKAGRPPRSCARGTTDKMSLEDVAMDMATVPADKQGEPFETAFFDFLDHRHPCKLAARSSVPAPMRSTSGTGRLA